MFFQKIHFCWLACKTKAFPFPKFQYRCHVEKLKAIRWVFEIANSAASALLCYVFRQLNYNLELFSGIEWGPIKLLHLANNQHTQINRPCFGSSILELFKLSLLKRHLCKKKNMYTVQMKRCVNKEHGLSRNCYSQYIVFRGENSYRIWSIPKLQTLVFCRQKVLGLTSGISREGRQS